MTNFIEKYNHLDSDLDTLKDYFLENIKEINGPIQIYTHLDSDGLSAGAILGKALFRKDIPFKITVLKQLEREEIVKGWSGNGSEKGIHIQRYKGLGEMNAEQLWKTTMDPEFRTLRQVTIENGTEADRVFSMLMGDEVPPRREFIEKNAKYANIDV